MAVSGADPAHRAADHEHGGPWCAACGAPGSAGDEPEHTGCPAALELDTPRFCTRCGRRLDVQVYPTGFAATCRRCDGVHPRDRGRA